jgi:spore maturation protein CgeB
VGLVTSFCPDAQDATMTLLDSPAAVKAYYDMDTPVTLHELLDGRPPAYVPAGGLAPFDLVLSYTGGRAIDGLVSMLGARRVVPLYGSVDPDVHRPVARDPRLRSSLSYLGTYASDRQAALDGMFLEPARQKPELRFVLAGSLYPERFDWQGNVFYLSHLPPGDHAAFYSSSAWTLNITRGPMAALGYCPSGRLFEAAACGTPIVSDTWDGLETFFNPGEEIVVAGDTRDVLAALDLGDEERRRIGIRGRQRALDCHTAASRAAELEQHIASALHGRAPALQHCGGQ